MTGNFTAVFLFILLYQDGIAKCFNKIYEYIKNIIFLKNTINNK